MQRIVLSLTMTLCISTAAFSAVEFTDAEAKALLEKMLNALSDDLKLGQLKLSQSAKEPDFEQGIITYSIADDYPEYEKADLLLSNRIYVFRACLWK